MASDTDHDVPDSGAAFTFGKSRFSDNLPGKFWIRDDPILQVACGDEHTALLTASGRIFTFGNNEWGQLGHGHTKPLTKPTCVKGIRHERATVLTCGRSHTLVATDAGHVYGFGANGECQLGCSDEQSTHVEPVRVQGLEGITIKMLCGGADHSLALTDKGTVYAWGGGSEGQLGLERFECLIPTEVKLDTSAICIGAGYYHSAFVTVDGKLYTCGESDSGKLGLPDPLLKKTNGPQHVQGISGKVVWTSCGGNHTVALTADGKVYSFGIGFNGQLGLGTKLLEASVPHQVSFPEGTKIARASCGENHTGFLADSGHLYTCGDGRHGKLGLVEDDVCSNQFVTTMVTRFQDFQVQQVACGGCHMLVLAVKRGSLSSSPIRSYQSFEEGADSCPARERRRQKNTQLPPLPQNFSPSSFQGIKTEDSVPTLRPVNKMRLPSISKGPVWYVPLEDDVAALKDTVNTIEDDEVLERLEQRCSLLHEVEEDDTIRHVDSDVESETSEVADLNRTHTLIRIDNTISILRPVAPSQEDFGDVHLTSNILTEENKNDKNSSLVKSEKQCRKSESAMIADVAVNNEASLDHQMSSPLHSEQIPEKSNKRKGSKLSSWFSFHHEKRDEEEDSESKDLSSQLCHKKLNSSFENVKEYGNEQVQTKMSSSSMEKRQSHFYDGNENQSGKVLSSPTYNSRSSSSKRNKSSKACVII